MSVNHDRFFYRTNDLCTFINFKNYRQKLKYCCKNLFEAQNARRYLRDELYQEFDIFAKYYHLFCQKIKRSQLNKLFLIDYLKRDINFVVQNQSI